jgi:hypothetical protein
VPAVYLAQPFTGKITPIGFGVLSESQLVERIAIVAASPGAATPSWSGAHAQAPLTLSREPFHAQPAEILRMKPTRRATIATVALCHRSPCRRAPTPVT